jgi:hypothetical protein
MPRKRDRPNPSENMTGNRSRPGNAQAAGRDLENEILSSGHISTWNTDSVEGISSDLSFGYIGAVVDSDDPFAALFNNSLNPQEGHGFWAENLQDPDLSNAVDATHEGLGLSAARVATETEEIPTEFMGLHRNESRSSNSSDWVEVDPVHNSTDDQFVRSDASSSTSLVSVSSNSGPLRHPTNNSEAVNSASTKKPRGHFKSSEKREKTSQTRKMHACVRCRMQRVRVSVT